MQRVSFICFRLFAGLLFSFVFIGLAAANPRLGLPPVPVPADNPQTQEKIRLGDKLFHDPRFSQSGGVACSTCHDSARGFTDGPLNVSFGVNGKQGTRNAPTIINSAFNQTLFWDGRASSLEDQAKHPFVNPVEMGLADHQPILDKISENVDYQALFKSAFGVSGDEISIEMVFKAIAAFERDQVSGGSPFDRWFFGNEADALTESAKRGFDVFVGQGQCQQCHSISDTHALFTDHRFYNVDVGFRAVESRLSDWVTELTESAPTDHAVSGEAELEALTDASATHLGRFVVDRQLGSIGAFKTPTLRNVALTAPYMHDGSMATLKEVVEHFNRGGLSRGKTHPLWPSVLSPLSLSQQQMDDLVAFMGSLTSEQAKASTPAPKFGIERARSLSMHEEQQ